MGLAGRLDRLVDPNLWRFLMLKKLLVFAITSGLAAKLYNFKPWGMRVFRARGFHAA
jgi:hypothetical protein